MDFETRRRLYLDRIETCLTNALAHWRADAALPESRVEDAAAYALLGGGKRLRAMLALAAGEYRRGGEEGDWRPKQGPPRSEGSAGSTCPPA